MANVKRNTLAGQVDQYFTPFLDWLRVPQKGEPGYVPVTTSQEDILAIEKARKAQAEQSIIPVVENKIPVVPEMNPVVKEYISSKIRNPNLNKLASDIPKSQNEEITAPMVKKPDYMEKYNDDAYSKAKADADSRQDGLGGLQFLAGFGDALAQRSPMESAKNFENIRARIKDDTIGQFNRDKTQAVEDFKSKQLMNKYDSSSDESKAFRKMIEAQFPNVAKAYGKNWEMVSAADKENIFEPLKLKENIEARKDAMRIAADSRQDAKDSRDYEKRQQLATPFGEANTPDDAKQLKEAYEAKKNFDNKIEQMIDLRKKYGGELLNRDAIARGKQLSKDLLLEYKNMAKLGVLSKADEDIINAIIPEDPLAFSMMPGQDPVMTKLNAFKNDSDKDFSTRVQTRTKSGIKELQTSQQMDSTSFPKQVRKGNQIATVSNAQELKEAQDEGFR